jgi:rRNA-processing protein FCF1
LVERHRRHLAGSGVGWADAQIVVAAARAGALVHTSDRAIAKVCARIGVPLAR